MIHAIILVIIGYIVWKFIPGKITAGSRKMRSYIDLGAQILGILLMLSGIVKFIKYLFL